MAEPTKLTIAAAYALYETINQILFQEDGKERPMSFDVKYKLIRCKDVLEKDVMYFEEARKAAFNDLGEKKEDKTEIPEDKKAEFEARLQKVMKKDVEHNFMKLSLDDVKKLGEDNTLNLPYSGLELFMVALVDDPEFLAEMKSPIDPTEK